MGSSVGQDSVLSLELDRRLPLLVIQPLYKLGKQMFWFILSIICLLHSYLCPCTPYAWCQIKCLVCITGREASVCIVCPESGVTRRVLGSVSYGWITALLQIFKCDGEDCSFFQPAVFICNHYFVLKQSSYLGTYCSLHFFNLFFISVFV